MISHIKFINVDYKSFPSFVCNDIMDLKLMISPSMTNKDLIGESEFLLKTVIIVCWIVMLSLILNITFYLLA